MSRVRFPSPWVFVPVLIGTLAGGTVGYLVTQVSCSPGSCTLAAAAIGLVSAAVTFFGIGTVVVLVLRSLAEWRAEQERGGPPQRGAGGPAGPPAC